MLLVAACSNRKQSDTRSGIRPDTIAMAVSSKHALTARMHINPVIKVGDSVLLNFTVFNTTNKDQTFCKWHTPFEPPMSKYLDVLDDKRYEVQYLGAMAKRAMPPPANSYLTVKSGDSLSITVDLRKSYQIDKLSKYTLKYNSEDISGLSIKDSVSFEYLK